MAKRYPPLPPSNPGGKRIVVPLKAAGTTSKKTPPLRPSGRGLKRTSPLPAARETAPYELFTEDVISGMPRTEEARSLEPTEFVFGPDSIPIQPTRLIRPTQRLGFRLPGATFWPFQWIDQTCRDVLDQSGLKAIRTDFFWDDRRGYGDEYTLDTVMKEARERKIDVLAIADDEYREDTHEYNYTNPETIAKLKEHCRYLADRYKPRGALAQREQWGDDFGVRYWQIGNEENHPTKPYPFAYLRLFRACVEGIREADPDAKIVMGGLWGRFCGGYDDPHSPRNYLDWLFEDDFFRDNVDVIAIHPYRRPATPDNAVRDQFEREQFCTLEKELRSLKDFVDARSPRDLPIWITEIGWHTDEDYQGEFRAAKCMTRSFNIMLDLPFVKRVYWFNLMHSTEEHFRHFEFHLFRSDATATQAGEVLRWPAVPRRVSFVEHNWVHRAPAREHDAAGVLQRAPVGG